MHPRRAGAPPANSTFFCIESACFIYSSAAALFSEARRACISLGGSLVKYDQAAKQSQVRRQIACGQLECRWGYAPPPLAYCQIPGRNLEMAVENSEASVHSSDEGPAVSAAEGGVLLLGD